MSARSIEVFKNLQSAQHKFEYFIFGITVALFAYIGEKYNPEPISLSQNTFELSALIILVITIIIGFKRLENHITSQAYNFHKLHQGEKLGSIKKALLTPGEHICENGDLFDREKGQRDAEAIQSAIINYNEKMKNIDTQNIKLYKWRNRLLIFGFVLLAISKVAGAYLSK